MDLRDFAMIISLLATDLQRLNQFYW